MFVYVQNCVRVARARTELRMCLCYEYKTMNALLVRGLVRRIRIQNVTLKIHFPVPKYLCKQATTVAYPYNNDNYNFSFYVQIVFSSSFHCWNIHSEILKYWKFQHYVDILLLVCELHCHYCLLFVDVINRNYHSWIIVN